MEVRTGARTIKVPLGVTISEIVLRRDRMIFSMWIESIKKPE